MNHSFFMKRVMIVLVLMGSIFNTRLLAQQVKSHQRYKIAVIDLMLLKRQKPGALPLAKRRVG